MLNYIFATQRYTDVNNAMLEQYQVTREKFLSLTSSDIFAHDPQQGLRLRRQLFDDGHLHLQTYERKSDGTPVWFEGDYVCMYDDQKRITGFFGIQRDITDRKKSNRNVRVRSRNWR
ncbi:PAS domain-containing protein [Candidatus Villigracilis affinis]|uniref:PAS domain-containing protein n=1 Tax=Candidatus Villigracilis affinis TaxID=3140682 RepID=UPI001D5BA44C|nr:PAS domain-containing protein [Anaerolineales bacterium]